MCFHNSMSAKAIKLAARYGRKSDIVEIYQDIFLYSKTPKIESLIIISILALSTFLIAMFLYKKMISAIKDII